MERNMLLFVLAAIIIALVAATIVLVKTVKGRRAEFFEEEGISTYPARHRLEDTQDLRKFLNLDTKEETISEG